MFNKKMAELSVIKEGIENGKIVTTKALREIAKNLKIPKWYDKKKNELKLEILFVVEHLMGTANEEGEDDMYEENDVIMANEEVEEVSTMENENDTQEMRPERKSKTKREYIDNIECGQVIAFNIARGKAMSAKIDSIEYDSNARVTSCKCVNIVGVRFNVPRDAIIWVKTGKRWPRGIFEKLIAGSEGVIKYAEECDE